MSGEASNPKPANTSTILQLHDQVYIERAENVHLSAGDVTQGQKASTSAKLKKKMNEVEEKVAEVWHTQEKLFHI